MTIEQPESVPYFVDPQAQALAQELWDAYPDGRREIVEVAKSCTHPVIDANPQYAVRLLQHYKRLNIRVEQIRAEQQN